MDDEKMMEYLATLNDNEIMEMSSLNDLISEFKRFSQKIRDWTTQQCEYIERLIHLIKLKKAKNIVTTSHKLDTSHFQHLDSDVFNRVGKEVKNISAQKKKTKKKKKRKNTKNRKKKKTPA